MKREDLIHNITTNDEIKKITLNVASAPVRRK